jgi:glycosyltransferase involved in cell wall biosynthesis
MINVLKLGYFTHSSISPSETFIYDLVKRLDNNSSIDLTYVSGQIKPVKTDIKLKVVNSGFAKHGINNSFRAFKIGQALGGRGHDFKMNFQQKKALKSLNGAKLPKFDVAFVDYGTSAVKVYKYLMNNNIPFVVNFNGYDASSALEDPAYFREINKVFIAAEYLIVPSRHLKRRLILAGCPSNKISVMPYGIDYKSIKPLSGSERYASSPSVIFLGRLTAKKNPVALLHAFSLVRKQIPECSFTIIGDGQLRSKTENLIDELELRGCLEMKGVLSREDSFPIMNKHWVYAQHSVTANSGDQEGFPVSLAEAAAHALPLVSTIHSGITENIIHNETGFLVQEHDYEDMAERIIYLLKNPEVAEKMGQSGRIHISSICDPKKRVDKIIELMYSAKNNK